MGRWVLARGGMTTMCPLETYNKPLDRLTGESLLILELESLEDAGIATCLNSKQDWLQSHSVRLEFSTGARNMT